MPVDGRKRTWEESWASAASTLDTPTKTKPKQNNDIIDIPDSGSESSGSTGR